MTQDLAVTPGMCPFRSPSPRLDRLASPSTYSFSLVPGLLENGRIGFFCSSPLLLPRSGGSSLLERRTGTNSLLGSGDCRLRALCILFRGMISLSALGSLR